MIRINLLGGPRPKRGKGAAAAAAGEGPNPLVVMAIVAVIGVLGNGWYYNRVTGERDKLEKAIAAADQENKRLAQVKNKYDEAERQKEIYRKRVEIIDQLRSNQSGPVTLLNTIGDTINATDAVWLSSMRDNGNDISIEGTALSANAVANLIANLRKTNYFKTVEIKETQQDDSVKDMQAFSFSLVCEKQKKS